MSVRPRVALFLYYGVAARLPDSNFPLGGVWKELRARLCRVFLAAAGSGINVESHVFVADGRHVRIGSQSGLGTGSRVYGGLIGNNVMVGPEAVLLKDNHRYDDGATAIQLQGMTAPSLPIVEDGAWLGERVIVLPGRRIGTGAIVGAGSVVTRDVAPYEIVGGNPAQPIGHRR
jgi:maltose O-acetyltransferase